MSTKKTKIAVKCHEEAFHHNKSNGETITSIMYLDIRPKAIENQN